MHSVSEMGVNTQNVPAFLTKLWTLVEDANTDDMICWDASGVSFHIYDQARFAKEILPLYFKHSNIASFIRQLNMYGFRKVIHMESGAIKSEWDDVEFHHPYFVRGEECLLVNIKRKQSSTPAIRADPGVKLNHEDINRVLSDVQVMKQQQDSFTSKIDGMKRENEALWREVASLRQKHLKQQQIVNKLIEFMIHLVGGKKGLKTGLPLKRKMPLMISDTQQVANPKRQRYGKLSIEEVPQTYVVNSPESSNTTDVFSPLSSGPEIHDVTDLLLASALPQATPTTTTTNHKSISDQGIVRKTPAPSPAPVTIQTVSTSSAQKPQKVESLDAIEAVLGSSDLSSLVDSNFLQSLEPSASTSHSSDSALDRYNRLLKEGETFVLPNDMNTEIDTMQDQLDDLKDLLSGSQYHFDQNTILGLFNNDANLPPLPSNLEHLADGEEKAVTSGPNNIVGNELVSFPLDNSLPLTFPDLTDLMSPEQPMPNTQPSLNTGEDNYIVIDPMSFVNLPETGADGVDKSKENDKEKS